MAEAGAFLEARGLSKSFGGIWVLRDANLDLHLGEVHALMGENGAGKSTLAKLICGVHTPDRGEIRLGGARVQVTSPHVAEELGIALIHQEPLTFPDLDVAENIFMGHHRKRGGLHRVNWSDMYSEARALLDSLGVPLDPRARVAGLSIADQQMVEMASALSQNARVLMMDEPTAALTQSEVDHLFGIVRRLREQGTAVVFISHRLDEVMEISDRITVLRDGEKVGSLLTAEATQDTIIRMMVGRPLSALFERENGHADHTDGEPLLAVEHLSQAGVFADISLEVHSGEIVGLAGLVGSGRTDVANAIFGITRPDSGAIRVSGRPVTVDSPQTAIGLGMAYVPEDRAKHGLLLPFTVSANSTLASLPRLARRGWLRPEAERQAAAVYRNELQIHLRDLGQTAVELSGGNQQKVVLAKWLMTTPQVLILDEPTRGIDIGAKAEVYRLMRQLVRQGKGILMISSELPEVLALSDRILVMREGRIVGRFAGDAATPEGVMAAATGQG